MYQLHYDYMKNKYQNRSKLLPTETDRLMCEIEIEDVYEDFTSNEEIFDFSNYSNKSKYLVIQINQSLEKWKMKLAMLRLKNLSDLNQRGIYFW